MYLPENTRLRNNAKSSFCATDPRDRRWFAA